MNLAATDKITAGKFFLLKNGDNSISLSLLAAFAHPAFLSEDHFKNVKRKSNFFPLCIHFKAKGCTM